MGLLTLHPSGILNAANTLHHDLCRTNHFILDDLRCGSLSHCRKINAGSHKNQKIGSYSFQKLCAFFVALCAIAQRHKGLYKRCKEFS